MPQAISDDRLSRVLFYGVVLLLAYLVFRVFEPFLLPLGWAGVLVVVFYPLHERLERRLGRRTAAAVSTIGVTLILIVPTLLVMTFFVRDGVVAAVEAVNAAPDYIVGRRLIAARAMVAPERLADISVPAKSLA